MNQKKKILKTTQLMGGGDGKKDASVPQSGTRVDGATFQKPTIKFLHRVRSLQYVHLASAAGEIWVHNDPYKSEWSFFGQIMSERDAAELVRAAPEVLDQIRPLVEAAVQDGVMSYLSRNWARMARYWQGDGEEPPPSLAPSLALVDLISLRDVMEIAANTMTAATAAFTMDESHAAIFWKLRSSHRQGAHPVYLATFLENQTPRYEGAGTRVTILVVLCTMIEDDSSGALLSIEAQKHDVGQSYQYISDTMLGNAREGKPPRAREIARSTNTVNPATPEQLSGAPNSLEWFLETLLMGSNGLLSRANLKTHTV